MAINNTHFQSGDYLTADRVNNILDSVKEIENVNIENGEGQYSLVQTPEKENFTTANPFYENNKENIILDETTGNPKVGSFNKGTAVFGSKAQASGSRAIAEGSGTIASGAHAHSEGCDTIAAGADAHAEGWGTLAKGEQAHAEGTGTQATGKYTHAEGDNTIASGYAAHSEGYKTEASNINAHAEGNSTKAKGEHSHSQNFETEALGTASTATGYQTKAIGNHSTTMGKGTIATSNFGLARGRYNIEDVNGHYADIVGNGDPDTLDEEGNFVNSNRSNAYTLDWYGNAWFKRSVTCSSIILVAPNGKKLKLSVDNDLQLIEEPVEE